MTISYDAHQQYRIQFKSPKESNNCDEFSPSMRYHAHKTYERDDKEGEEIVEIHLPTKIERIDQINTIKIQLYSFSCEELDGKPISIPLIQGKPFGKNDTLQIIDLKNY